MTESDESEVKASVEAPLVATPVGPEPLLPVDDPPLGLIGKESESLRLGLVVVPVGAAA